MHLSTKSYLFLLLISIFLSGCFKQPLKSPDANALVVYPPPPAETRIQYLTSFSKSTDFTGEQSPFNKFVFGEEVPLPIIKPYGISVHNSKIYICDTGIKGLEILNLEDHSFVYFIPAGLGQLQFPINCALDQKGNIYVADGNRRQVVIFDENLNYVNAISLQNNSKPTDLAIDDEYLWITALDDHKIHVYKLSDLSYEGAFPECESNEKGYLYQAANLAATDSTLIISDLGGCRIITYNKSREFMGAFGSPGKGYGQFTRPKGITVDDAGHIFVVDAAFENVQVFNSTGQLLMHFGGTYKGPGGMWLPADVTIDRESTSYFSSYVNERFSLDYVIFVTNQYGPDKISVYGFVNNAEP